MNLSLDAGFSTRTVYIYTYDRRFLGGNTMKKKFAALCIGTLLICPYTACAAIVGVAGIAGLISELLGGEVPL